MLLKLAHNHFTMQYWLKISCFICTFGFLKEIRPSDPYLFHDYLITKGVTAKQVNHEILPVRIYSHLGFLVIVFLITDLCRYKPLIITLGLAATAASAFFIWTKTKFHFQIAALLLGLSDACEVAYYTYIYAKVDQKFFRQVTSFTISATLIGRFISGLLAQLLLSTNSLDFGQLHYITFSALILATCWSIFLPSAGNSVYFHQENHVKTSILSVICSAFVLMKKHFIESFSNTYVLKWIIWLILSTSGYILVVTYTQLLWGEVSGAEGHKYPYNGTAEALATMTGFLTALFAGWLQVDWTYKVELALTVNSLLLGFITLVSSQASSTLTCFICYAIYAGLFFFMSTIATSEIVKHIQEDSFGLVLGVSTFFSLIVQSVLTIVIVTKGGALELAPRQQHTIFGLYHILLALIYIIIGFTNWAKVAEQVYSRSF